MDGSGATNQDILLRDDCDGVATLTLNRPARFNTLSEDMLAALQTVIPMKVVAWASGIVGIPIGPYLACMAVGRGKRLYLIAAAIRWGGEKAEAALRRNVERLGWAFIAIIAVALIAYFIFRPA